MSAVFREIAVEFGGKEYTFTPSNKLLRKIDAGLSPQTLLGLMGTMNGKELPIYGIAYVVSEFIKAGGGDATEDDVIFELQADLRDNNGKGVRPLVASIADALSPPDAVKNHPSPAE